ncbi:MAG: hypothetical protein U0798_11385 [Gemmataceae bacterium]
MPMPPYPVFCQSPECGNLATHKVASEWSDVVTSELKTYALCCESCVPHWLEIARDRQRVCHLTDGESLGIPKVIIRSA